ncbi:hypothetical protein C6T71_20005 [Burkholderia multivorans]|nr:hypothetical protein C6T71_20005 [Burkholderia multivorans]
MCLGACLPACLLACLPACLLACLPACLLACLRQHHRASKSRRSFLFARAARRTMHPVHTAPHINLTAPSSAGPSGTFKARPTTRAAHRPARPPARAAHARSSDRSRAFA